MCALENNRNEILSRIIADLASKSGEELSSAIQHLRREITNLIEHEDTLLGQFRRLVESFLEVIPDEKLRYNAAVKALSATSKLSRQLIVKGLDNQIEELKILERALLYSLPWRGELIAMEARSREIRDETKRMQGVLRQLENEATGITGGTGAWQQEAGFAERTVSESITGIAAEMTAVRNKLVEFTGGSPVPPETASSASVTSAVPAGMPGAGNHMNEIREAPVPVEREQQKTCPLCGGLMDFRRTRSVWLCYSCAHEEPLKDDIRERNGGITGQKPVPSPKSIFGEPSPPENVPSASPAASKYLEANKSLSLSRNHPSKRKNCPACRKKMIWYENEGAWKCPFCKYERRF